MPHRFLFHRITLWCVLSVSYRFASTFLLLRPTSHSASLHLDSPGPWGGAPTPEHQVNVFRLKRLLASLEDGDGARRVSKQQIGDIEVLGGQFQSEAGDSAVLSPLPLNNVTIPPPLHLIADVNIERRSIVYEVVLGRELGIEIVQGVGAAVVGQVTPGSAAEQLGIKEGDIIAATSATAGDQLWMHNSADGVKSALNTRFVMSPTVTVRLERDLAKIPDDVVASLQVPYTFLVRLKRPIGLHVVEGPGKGVYVQYIKPDLGAARSKMLEVGDKIVAMSASWGDRMWEVNNVESFVVGVRMRTDTQLSFKLKRMVPLEVYTGKSVGRLQRQERRAENKEKAEAARSTGLSTLVDQIEHVRSIPELLDVWRKLQSVGKVTHVSVNKIMSQALVLEDPGTAIDIFESTFAFDPDPARDIMRFLDEDSEEGSAAAVRVRRQERERAAKKDKWAGGRPLAPDDDLPVEAVLQPNAFVCTTAAKAYGRRQQPAKALALLAWLEDHGERVDVYFLSALLFVCAKAKRVAEAERLFWVEVPKRNLTYTVATTNSLMYMYARTNRPDDALKVYELTKQLGLKCTVVTYGVLIKALMGSGKKHLEDTSFEILRSLPGLGISPGVEVYNQFFERYARTHNYRGTKMVLRLMSQAKPSVKPDAVTYGYLISCFSESKKPRSALAIFYQMRKRRVEPNAYTYMGVLKALSHMRDGMSAVQVIGEMRDKGVTPDNRHYAMAMFACVTANQCSLAESVFASYVRSGERPDTALYTLYMRALLQQGKWTEGTALFSRMLAGNEIARPNHHTLNCLMQYQVLGRRFSEAADTLALLLQREQRDGKRDGKRDDGSIDHTYRALSFGLGHYSSQMQRMQRDDQYHQARQGAFKKHDRLDLIGMMNAGEVSGTTNFFSAETMLATPSPEALEFLVTCIGKIGEKRFLIQGDFYLEVLRALVLENQPGLARELLDLREGGVIRLRDEDVEQAAPIEELARRALKAWKKSANASPRML